MGIELGYAAIAVDCQDQDDVLEVQNHVLNVDSQDQDDVLEVQNHDVCVGRRATCTGVNKVHVHTVHTAACLYPTIYCFRACNETTAIADVMLMLITNTLGIEPDPLHGEEEGSGNAPTLELSPQNAWVFSNCGGVNTTSTCDHY